MKTYSVIGIGGTGSRAIESIVFLCSAGFGPEKLSVTIVDPDVSNGNLSKTTNLLKLYKEIRDSIHKQNENIDYFKTEIIFNNNPVWTVLDTVENTNDMKLSNLISYSVMENDDKKIKDLVDLLFTQQELETKLTEGFRGHPSIGAVTMTQDKFLDKPAWSQIKKNLETNKEPDSNYIFIIGSIFGGTGAAGIPTFAHKDILKTYNEQNKSSVVLGGALILPYFSFDIENYDSTEDAKTNKLFAKWEDYNVASKAALNFYAEKDLAFDDLYLIGDNSSHSVGKFATGQSAQKNKPHVVEMITAFAVFDFFKSSEKARKDMKPRIFYASRLYENVINWDSIPIYREGDKDEVYRDFKSKLINFSISAIAYCVHGKEELLKNYSKSFRAWVRMLSKKYPVVDKPTLFENYAKFNSQFISWAFDLSMKDYVKLLTNPQIEFLFDKDGNIMPSDNLESDIIGTLYQNSNPKKMTDYVMKLDRTMDAFNKSGISLDLFTGVIKLFHDVSIDFGV